MNTLASIMLLCWVPGMLLMGSMLPLRTALLVAGIGGWLLLPEATFQLQGLPNYSKSNAISLAMLLVAFSGDSGRIRSVRLSLWDLPALCLVAAPFCSSTANGTGIYDGVSSSVYQFVNVFIPYWIGKAFFANAAGARALIWGVFVGGLCYVAPCLYEVRMSPTLHLTVYGYFQHAWDQMVRGGGYRPIVFTPHALALALWMSVATVAGMALWRRARVHEFGGIPMGALIGLVGLAALLCKSMGSLILMGLGILMVLQVGGRSLQLFLLIAAPTYMLLRIFGAQLVDGLLVAIQPWLPEERAISFYFRVENEAFLIDRAWTKPIFGWTPWSFLDAIVDEDGNSRALVSDSLWVITFTINGFFGLISLVAFLMLPSVRTLRWSRREFGLTGARELSALAIIATLFLVDCISNSFFNPAYLLAIGAVVGATLSPATVAARPAPRLPRAPAPLRPGCPAPLRPRAARHSHQA